MLRKSNGKGNGSGSGGERRVRKGGDNNESSQVKSTAVLSRHDTTRHAPTSEIVKGEERKKERKNHTAPTLYVPSTRYCLPDCGRDSLLFAQ